jgi:hypothetical protein
VQLRHDQKLVRQAVVRYRRDATPASRSATMTSARTAATAAALTATLGLAAASWVVAVRRMNGMDMGVATRLGSFAFFVALWVSMMAAMMLPGAGRHRRAGGAGDRRVGILIVIAPWSVPGLTPPMGDAVGGAGHAKLL